MFNFRVKKKQATCTWAFFNVTERNERSVRQLKDFSRIIDDDHSSPLEDVMRIDFSISVFPRKLEEKYEMSKIDLRGRETTSLFIVGY